MKYDLTTRSQRLGWFRSSLKRVSWLDIITGVVITCAVSGMIANLAYYYGVRQ